MSPRLRSLRLRREAGPETDIRPCQFDLMCPALATAIHRVPGWSGIEGLERIGPHLTATQFDRLVGLSDRQCVNSVVVRAANLSTYDWNAGAQASGF